MKSQNLAETTMTLELDYYLYTSSVTTNKVGVLSMALCRGGKSCLRFCIRGVINERGIVDGGTYTLIHV